MAINILKKLYIAIIVCLLLPALSLPLTGCKSAATFGPVVACESINNETMAPEKTNNVFEITASTIYAVVSYKDINKDSSYYFIWTNLDTGEKNVTEKYSCSKKGDLKSGYLVSVFTAKNTEVVLTPGKYMAEFFYDDKQKSKMEFEVKKPVMQMISVDLAKSIKADNSPVEKMDKFTQFDAVHACIKFNYLIKDNTVNVKWYDNNQALILESSNVIDTNNYLPTYIPFGLQNKKGFLPFGIYKIEVFLNNDLIKTESFEILETDLNISAFEDNYLYENKEFGFSFYIPDKWTYNEIKIENGFLFQLIPASPDIEIGFLFMVKQGVTDSSKEFYKRISGDMAKSFIAEKNLTEIKVTDSENVSDKNLNYYAIIKYYKDASDVQWITPFCFFPDKNNLFIAYGIANGTLFGKDADTIFNHIVNSLELK
jgi:hypothetical protein